MEPRSVRSATSISGRNGSRSSIERVRLKDSGIAVEGSFELPHLARLTMEDQIFVMAFVRSHGSIKEMEGGTEGQPPASLQRSRRDGDTSDCPSFMTPEGPARGGPKGFPKKRVQAVEVPMLFSWSENKRE